MKLGNIILTNEVCPFDWQVLFLPDKNKVQTWLSTFKSWVWFCYWSSSVNGSIMPEPLKFGFCSAASISFFNFSMNLKDCFSCVKHHERWWLKIITLQTCNQRRKKHRFWQQKKEPWSSVFARSFVGIFLFRIDGYLMAIQPTPPKP